jgi:hypothetical protein
MVGTENFFKMTLYSTFYHSGKGLMKSLALSININGL